VGSADADADDDDDEAGREASQAVLPLLV